jgi:drug/metabolite transporter (DMT)-like permease
VFRKNYMAPLYALIPASFSLGAVFSWGASDFVGGYAARRANAFLLTTVAHASGLLLIIALALANHSACPSRSNIAWALVAGLSGGGALAIFYRALAAGKMGLTAPIAAVLSAAIPTAFTIGTEGSPGIVPIAGFALAGIGILLISRTEGNTHADGIGLAVLAGVGFAGFFLCIKQAGNGSALWISTFSRLGSLVVPGIIVLGGRTFGEISRPGVGFGVLAGCLDVTGSALFVRASQTGRLDTVVALTSLYPAVTVLLARLLLKEHFARWKALGMVAALLAVPMIAWQ